MRLSQTRALPYFCAALDQVSLNVVCTVPDLSFARRIRVQREIAEALELIALFRTRISKRGFAFCIRYFQRFRIYEGFEIAAGIRLRNSEKPIIQTDFRIDRLLPRSPNESSL